MNDNSMKIISSCPLCEEHSLHVFGKEPEIFMQCLYCGYVSSPKFIGNKDECKSYKELTDIMKRWSKFHENRIWIPTMMTLPIGMLYPFDDEDKNMKWGYAEMVDIPKEEQKNYPAPDGQFYTKTYDTNNAKIYDTFFEAMLELNEKTKKEPQKLKLPKLKKM